MMDPHRCEEFMALRQFALDCCSPEGYGHALPREVVLRAARILKLAPAETISERIEPDDANTGL